MVGRKKQSDDDDNSSSEDEVLSKIKKTNAGKKDGKRTSAKRQSGRKSNETSRKSKTKAAETSSDEESDSQVNSAEDSESEKESKSTKKKSSKSESKKPVKNGSKSKDTNEKRKSARSSKDKRGSTSADTPSRPKRSDRSKSTENSAKESKNQNEESSQEESDQSDADDHNEVSKKSSEKRERKPKTDRPKKQKEKEDEYEVEEIIDFKIEDNLKYFLVRWKGYDSSADTWIYRRDLNCTGLVEKFYEKHPEARISTHKRKKKADFINRKKKSKKIERTLKIDEQPDYDSEAFDENQEWKVEKIIDVRHHLNKKRDFLIRWEGFSSKSDSWEPEENLDCKDLIKKFTEKLEALTNVTEKELRPFRKPTQHFTLMTQSGDRRLSKRHNGRQRAVYYDCE